MGQLDGQVAVITGGARGMGRSHAHILSGEGADIVLIDLCADIESIDYPLATPADLEATRCMVEENGRRCLTYQLDVRDYSAVEHAIHEARDSLGRVDILIANAGVSGGDSIQVAAPEQWRDVIDTNLTGVFHAFRAAAPIMIGQHYGRLVGISSMVGRGATGAVGAYVASKWGVIGLVKSTAQDLAPFGITVNAVAPGNIDTPMIRNDALARKVRPDLANPTFDDARKFIGMLHAQPIAVLPPEEISAAILFLVGPSTPHMTGAVLDVNAGYVSRTTA